MVEIEFCMMRVKKQRWKIGRGEILKRVFNVICLIDNCNNSDDRMNDFIYDYNSQCNWE